MYYAALAGNLAAIQMLVDHGCNIDQQTLQERETALHAATKKGSLDVIKLLLQLQANPDLKNAAGRTIFHEAVRSGQLELVKVNFAFPFIHFFF